MSGSLSLPADRDVEPVSPVPCLSVHHHAARFDNDGLNPLEVELKLYKKINIS